MHHNRFRKANAIDALRMPSQPALASPQSSDRGFHRSSIPIEEPHFAISYDLKSPEPFPDFALSTKAWALFTGFIVVQPRLEYCRSALRHNICDSDRRRYLAILARKGTHQDAHDIITKARFHGFQNEGGPMPMYLQDALARRFRDSFPIGHLELTRWLAMMAPVVASGMVFSLLACDADMSKLDFLGKDGPQAYQLFGMFIAALGGSAVLEFLQTKRKLTEIAIEMLGCDHFTSKDARSLILETVFSYGKPSMLPAILAKEAQSYRTDPLSG